MAQASELLQVIHRRRLCGSIRVGREITVIRILKDDLTLRRMTKYLIIAAVTLAVATVWLASPTPSFAAFTTQRSVSAGNFEVWGAYGIWTKEAKNIRTYKKRGGAKVYLKCGGPNYTSDPTWGFRHIERYHLSQFETKSFGILELAAVPVDRATVRVISRVSNTAIIIAIRARTANDRNFSDRRA